MSQQAIESQLDQVSNYLASNLLDLVTFMQMIEGDQFVVKTVDIPYSINNNLYNIALTSMPSSDSNVNVIRLITSVDKLNLYSITDLPWAENSRVVIYSNQQIPSSEIVASSYLCSNKAASEKALRNEPTSMMIWCMKKGNVLTIGLGVTELQ